GAAEFARDLPHGLWRFAADGSGTTAEAVIRGIPVDIEWQRKESSERAAPPANRVLRSRE
ncbi:MAG TPA: hypothetical protein VK116_15865, partial [Planctomycetota bacterium]|nr:hypothetical protein [Planctomycetota bacterium]